MLSKITDAPPSIIATLFPVHSTREIGEATSDGDEEPPVASWPVATPIFDALCLALPLALFLWMFVRVVAAGIAGRL